MRSADTRVGTFLAYTALAIPFVLLAVGEALHWIDPLHSCVAVNPGGKEFICGGEYAPRGLRIFSAIAMVGWVATVLFGTVAFLNGVLTRGAKVAWSVSAILLILAVWAILAFSGDPTP
jgi:hypothetical protein